MKEFIGKEIKDLLLFVDDRGDVSRMFERVSLKRNLPYRILIARNLTDAYMLTMDFLPNVIISDYDLEGEFTGVDFLRDVKERFGNTIEKAIILSGEPPSDQTQLGFIDKIFVKGATKELFDYLKEHYRAKYAL